MLPIIRTFISLPAGVARMPFWKFSVLTLAGCVPWVFVLTFAGQKAAENWDGLEGLPALRRLRGRRAHRRSASSYLAVRWWRNRNRGRAADAPA